MYTCFKPQLHGYGNLPGSYPPLGWHSSNPKYKCKCVLFCTLEAKYSEKYHNKFGNFKCKEKGCTFPDETSTIKPCLTIWLYSNRDYQVNLYYGPIVLDKEFHVKTKMESSVSLSQDKRNTLFTVLNLVIQSLLYGIISQLTGRGTGSSGYRV